MIPPTNYAECVIKLKIFYCISSVPTVLYFERQSFNLVNCPPDCPLVFIKIKKKCTKFLIGTVL